MILADTLITGIGFTPNSGIDMYLTLFEYPKIMLTAFIYPYTNNLSVFTYY
jgi:hypothetical protein